MIVTAIIFHNTIIDPCFFLKSKNGLREDFYGERTGLEVIIIRIFYRVDYNIRIFFIHKFFLDFS